MGSSSASLSSRPCSPVTFPKLRSCRYETSKEMREAVTKVIDMLRKRTFMGPSKRCWNGTTGALQPDEMCALSIKVPIRKMSGNLSNAPRIYIYIYIHIYIYIFTKCKQLGTGFNLGSASLFPLRISNILLVLPPHILLYYIIL